jgi:DNA-binding response OmpR family regulator
LVKRIAKVRIVHSSGTLAKVAEQHPIRTHRALVIEDNEHIAFMLEFILQRSGYDVSTVHNGRDAQTAIEKLDPVDIVILDLMLPHVSGYQLINEIRDNVTWHQVPIVVLSARVLEDDIVKALDLGANDYVTKPFRPAELLARMRRIIADREQLMRAV